MVVRQYLAQKFRVDDARIKTLGLGENQSTTVDKSGRVTIVVYPGGQDRRVVAAKNK
jgi:outer membrane protein OmpA-like peptidoglycan-associated protein